MWRTLIAGGISSSRPIASPSSCGSCEPSAGWTIVRRRLARQRRGAEAHAVLAREQLAAGGPRRRGSGARRASARAAPRRPARARCRAAPRSSPLEHQPRLQLQQRRDQHDELGGGLEVELAALLEVVEVGEHDLGELQLEQVDLFAQHQRQQQVERPAEDVEVELERGEAHAHRGRLTRAHPRTVPAPATAASAPAPGRADAHPLAHVGERLRGDRLRALGAARRGSTRARPRRRAARS